MPQQPLHQAHNTCFVETDCQSLSCRQEQEVLQAAAEQEHSEALSAAKAALASSKQEMQQMQQQAQRMAWRSQRWQLAATRRSTLQASC